ncbi:MAG: prepilin-type N-terminal cleavage/methylation domain-containing protein [Gammaproteobacteria bacterium]|nr:prepilin-type N-terminal cleavage/methylation domain-containing protein [Gammaproteobacteria bacterium]
MIRKRFYQSGLTLIELLIAITIMGLAVTSLTSSIWQRAEQNKRLSMTLEIQQAVMSAQPLINMQLQSGSESGELQFGEILVAWQAQAIEQSETKGRMNFETLQLDGAGISLRLFEISIQASVESAYREYQYIRLVKG